MTTPRNWNRWGADDQRGTLNYLTAQSRIDAAQLVRNGKVYSLAIPLRADAPIWPTRHANWHVATHRNTQGPGLGSAEDILMMHTHGTTHLDALCHIFSDGQMYNGYSTLESITSRGTTKNAIFNVDAIVTRGVLLDVAGFHAVEHLEADHAITPEEVESVAARQGVEIRSGDALLFRTGFQRVWEQDHERFNAGQPGVNLDTARWAGEKEIVVMASDTSAVEIFPRHPPLQVHEEFIRNQGGYLMELLQLDDLARDRVYEFMFVVAPLRIDRGLGSPINPLAIA